MRTPQSARRNAAGHSSKAGKSILGSSALAQPNLNSGYGQASSSGSGSRMVARKSVWENAGTGGKGKGAAGLGKGAAGLKRHRYVTQQKCRAMILVSF